MSSSRLACLGILVFVCGAVQGADGNRLAYLDEFCDPYYAGLETARLTTPQWAGEPGVEAAVVLAIDDMDQTARYEKYLRPILERLKQIDGRAPVSIMTKHLPADDPQLPRWFEEGVNVETHTFDHPCPCLGKGRFDLSKATYDRSVDVLTEVTGRRAVAFRMPCCDSMNTASPRFFTEIFNRTTPAGNFVRVDSSIFLLFTAQDASLPRDLVLDERRTPRFAKYIPVERKFVNYIQDYPYPFVISRLCWEMPSPFPDDWQGINLQKPYNPITVRDMKAALDAAAVKQGQYTLTFHPGAWIRAEQVIELVDHAVARHGKRIKFYNFREVHDRLTAQVCGGQPLRAANGQDNGVRVLDINNDGYMDGVIGNENLHQTRLWSPQKNQWLLGDLPVDIVSVGPQGHRADAGVRFGVLQRNGNASLLVRNENTAGLWHFDGRRWRQDPQGLVGLELEGPVATSQAGRDRGVRLLDLDCDGVCELIVGNPRQQGVFQWEAGRGWKRLPFTLPAGTAFVDAQGRDAGLRLVDLDADGHRDAVFSDAQRYSLHLFDSIKAGWAKRIHDARRTEGDATIPPIVRPDKSNNGVWFKYGQLWVQNEDTGETVTLQGRPVLIPVESRAYSALLKAR